MERVSPTHRERSNSAATEYRERFMSPRREDYIQPAVLQKVSSARSPRSRSFLSFDGDSKDSSITSSEYRLCFANHHPKRPYVFHAQPSHVFDYVPQPINAKRLSHLSASMTSLKDTEYQERFPNYRAYIPTYELLPAHISPQPNVPSDTQIKRDRMAHSLYFHHLVSDDDKRHGGHRYVENSEQRAAYQWPHRYSFQPQQPQHEMPQQVYPAYFVPQNIYEPMPTVSRAIVR